MFSRLLKSEGRKKLFETLFKEKDRKFYLRELSDLLQYSAGSLQRELTALESDGILLAEKMGNMKFFSLNKKHPIIGELKKYLENAQEIPQKVKVHKKVKEENQSKAKIFAAEKEISKSKTGKSEDLKPIFTEVPEKNEPVRIHIA